MDILVITLKLLLLALPLGVALVAIGLRLVRLLRRGRLSAAEKRAVGQFKRDQPTGLLQSAQTVAREESRDVVVVLSGRPGMQVQHYYAVPRTGGAASLLTDDFEYRRRFQSGD